MQRFIPNYTCKKPEQTGITCLKALIDYYKNVKVYEKKIKDISKEAVKIKKKITSESPWKTPIIYDLANYSINKKHKTLIIREEEKQAIPEYGEKRREELKKKGLKDEIKPRIEEELLKVLKERPVIIFLNFNKLYNERDAGLGWVVITEYNKNNDEFIIYDPLYYTRLPKSKHWQRLPNTPKKRFISLKRLYLFKTWDETKKTKILLRRERKKELIQPFIREFLSISEKRYIR
jgi:hypothetical protein